MKLYETLATQLKKEPNFVTDNGELKKQMKAKSFLNYNVDIQKQEQSIEDFKALSLAEQKQH